MDLWRISRYETLDGVGGLYASGRWHTRGHPVVYLSGNPATSLLETLVHMEVDAEDRPERFQMIKVEAPDTLSSEVLEAEALAPLWRDDLAVTQEIGNQWLASGRSVLLRVPSALVPETWNVLANPMHPEAGLLRVVRVYQHPFDPRF